MECWEAQRLLDTFVDGYTDVPTNLDLQEHLEQCSQCQHELELEYRLRHLFTAPGVWEEAPAHLRRQIARRLSGCHSPVRRLVAGGALVLLCLMLVLGLLWSVQPTLRNLCSSWRPLRRHIRHSATLSPVCSALMRAACTRP